MSQDDNIKGEKLSMKSVMIRGLSLRKKFVKALPLPSLKMLTVACIGSSLSIKIVWDKRGYVVILRPNCSEVELRARLTTIRRVN